MPRSTQPVQIRLAVKQDVESILQCLLSAFAQYRGHYTPEAFEDTVLTPGLLEQRERTMSVFVAEAPTGQLIGTISCGKASKTEGHLRGMAVLPEWQGVGVAKQLLDWAEAELRQHRCERITLDTTEVLLPAMRFYERNGFNRTGKVSNFFGMPLIEYAKEI